MTPRLHVVGAGVAGLAAALAAARAGRAVSLHEAAGRAGGRCRGVEDASGLSHDNGTHVLLGANRQALRLLDAIGARDGWVEPEPDGLPIVDLAAGTTTRVGLSPWSWLLPGRRPPGLSLRELPRLARLALPRSDRSVTEVVGTGAFARAVVEPLTVAALNTPAAEASAARLARVLRRILAPGAGRLLVARRGLGPDLVEPALAALARVGVAPNYGRRLRSLAVAAGRAERLVFADAEVPLADRDEVVLALPPHALARLLPDLPLPDRYEPIVNLHYEAAHAGPVRFVGLLGGVGQWLLFRPGTVSVTVSAAREQVSAPAAALAAAVWPEVARAADLLGIGPLPAEAPPCRVVKERRATLSQPAGPAPRVPARPLANVALAGDWLSGLPATIEAAVASGVAAAGAPLRAAPGEAAPALAEPAR